MFNVRKWTATAGMASALLLAMAPNASANWQSHISSAATGFTSSRWEDESYSEVRFKGCTQEYAVGGWVKVALWEDNALSPDTNHGTKTFTNCFNGPDSISAGEWTGLSLDGYYFRLQDTDGGLLNVRVVAIDTTQAD
ncbi:MULTISPECIES: hypothetical protein [unclassified Streptomyces]|uniref:hypothetical protein n=1 Tax=unclassified Streptomyces TaxID=2593676 RepID=UPI002256E9D6|nr:MULTISPECIES: hypothetical protein [unclassified Streptomyces]MCX4851995.1 hypothetical protein [Streptomyces sp. NBC_00893]MCX4902607.1 hypothetical protein [Streptomyces sp. NBC_00892]